MTAALVEVVRLPDMTYDKQHLLISLQQIIDRYALSSWTTKYVNYSYDRIRKLAATLHAVGANSLTKWKRIS